MQFKSIIAALILLGIVNMSNVIAQSGTPFFTGTYTGKNSKGIYSYQLNKDGSMTSRGLAAETPNPSFLAKTNDNKYLLAVSEISAKDKTGMVKSYRIEGDSLVEISVSTSGGAHPCFVTVNPEGHVLVANYTGGNTALLKIDSRGELSGLLDLHQHVGSDVTERQKGPHAHSAWFVPGGQEVIEVDLGTNELWFSLLDKKKQKLEPLGTDRLKMNPGAGPRHLDIHPNGKWIYVVNELDCTVSLVIRNKKDGYNLVSSFSTLPENYEGKNSCADIHISKDGRFVYASNRGHNSIAIFSINKRNGELTLLENQSTKGKTPRNFAISPDGKFLLVANQNSDNIVSFRRDRQSGLLEYAAQIAAPKPVCIRF